uniref:Uncharacterized protein n=1 Tax=Anguilla anguilla TaxID=7936 RepID=A0A0E9VM73_ANGAN
MMGQVMKVTVYFLGMRMFFSCNLGQSEQYNIIMYTDHLFYCIINYCCI